MFEQIGGPSPDQFPLWRQPDGIYGVNGRLVPSTDETALSVDDRESVKGIHNLGDVGVGLLGAEGHLQAKEMGQAPHCGTWPNGYLDRLTEADC